MEEPILAQARMRNYAAAVVIEPVLIWRRGVDMEGVVEIQPPGWDKPFLAQVVLLASVAGIIRTTPFLWRLVRFDIKKPTLDEVQEACAQKILETAKEIRRMTGYKPKIPLSSKVKPHDDNKEEDYWAVGGLDEPGADGQLQTGSGRLQQAANQRAVQLAAGEGGSQGEINCRFGVGKQH